jgi:hypothetical protein
LWIWEITIEEPHRGRGLGKAAMVVAERRARSQGATDLGFNSSDTTTSLGACTNISATGQSPSGFRRRFEVSNTTKLAAHRWVGAGRGGPQHNHFGEGLGLSADAEDDSRLGCALLNPVEVLHRLGIEGSQFFYQAHKPRLSRGSGGSCTTSG